MAITLPSPAPTPATDAAALADQFVEAARAARVRSGPNPLLAVAHGQHLLAPGGMERVAAAALLASAWELPEAPRLAEVPDALWGSYMEWLLAVPERPEPVSSANLARHLAGRCEELAAWMDRNLASPPVRAAADAYLRSPAPPLEFLPSDPLLELQECRARILQRAHGRVPAAARALRPRGGRPLRVGVLHHRFDHRAETFTTLARCAQLDPRRIELHCIAFAPSGSALEERCREIAAGFHLLPEGLSARLQELNDLGLDCLVYGDPLARHQVSLAQIALFQPAPLQIATDRITTGLVGIDLLLSGETDAAAERPRAFSERIALLPGTSLAWDTTPDRAVTSAPWTRAALGVSDDQPLFMELAPVAPNSADIARWTRLLEQTPGLVLVLVPSPGQLDVSATRTVVTKLDRPGLILHEPPPFDHGDLASLLALADLATGLQGPAAALALEAGVPVLALASQPEAALLKSAGLEEMIAANETARLALALDLLGNREARDEARARFSAAAESMPRFADTYALASDFAGLLETAWDELCAQGHGRFRRQRDPLRQRAPHSLRPCDLHAEALALLTAGRPERAAPCLLSAIQRAPSDAVLWFDLARAYRAAGDMSAAIETLEASLRLDEDNAAGWRLFCELAVEAGNLDLARQALQLASVLAEGHPELHSLRARVAA